MSNNPENGRSTESPNGFNIAFQPTDHTVQKLVKPLFTEAGLRQRRSLDDGLIRLHLPGKFDLLGPVSTDSDLGMTAIQALAAKELGRDITRPLFVDSVFAVSRERKVVNRTDRTYDTVSVGVEFGFTLDAEDADFVDYITRAALRRRISPYVKHKDGTRGDMPITAISMGIPYPSLNYVSSDRVADFVTSKVHIANKLLQDDKKKRKQEQRMLYMPLSGIKIVEIKS